MQRYLVLLPLCLMPLLAHADAIAQKAVFAGGCFWCMEADFDKLKSQGVLNVVSGYDGGQIKNPTYEQVSAGGTHYREVIEVTYDPNKITYAQLVKYFFTHVDPTVNYGQFCDHGKQYTTAIYYFNHQQKQIAQQIKAQTHQALGKTIYTEVTPTTHFYPAESYHQDYYQKNPVRYKFYRWNCGRDKRVNAVWDGHRSQLDINASNAH